MKSFLRQGFTLVELSIVLVILGLLVGGVLAGQSLIRASELRAVLAERTSIQTALQSFRDKYFAIPGDMTNATSFWGKHATICNGQSGTASATGTCNGNGDGSLDDYGDPNLQEHTLGWQQLGLAGLLEGSYPLVSPVPNVMTPGVSSLASRLRPAAWGMGQGWFRPSNNPPISGYADRNYLCMGASLSSDCSASEPLFTGPEIWNMDTKIDDGNPVSGGMLAFGSCITSGGSVDDQSYAANDLYVLTDDRKKSCLPLFML